MTKDFEYFDECHTVEEVGLYQIVMLVVVLGGE